MEHGRQRSNWSITDTSPSDMSARKMSVRFNSLNDKSDFKETIGFTHEKPVYQRHLRYVRQMWLLPLAGQDFATNVILNPKNTIKLILHTKKCQYGNRTTASCEGRRRFTNLGHL